MKWLNTIVDDLIERYPNGEILIESGASPSGTYHLGHMRELMTADAILMELERRNRSARHIQYVDDFDALRKIPYNVPKEYEQYLGMPLCDIPAPDGSDKSYADYFLQGLIDACEALSIKVEFVKAHNNYRNGFMVPAIERSLGRIPQARQALETISGHKLDENWAPIQILEEKRLKNRKFISLDKDRKLLQYEDPNGNVRSVKYNKGEVKLDWRLDWPGRWWLLKVQCEPSGRDHMTKGSSYDTGVQIMKDVYEAEPPYPVSYDFINMAGDTKKMSASKGTGLDAVEASHLMPPEVMRYFVFRSPPLKRLYFDPVNGVVRLMDEFAALAARQDRDESENQLLYIATRGINNRTVSRVPFSLLVAAYQTALKDPDKTLEIINRSEYANVAQEDAEIIKAELKFIDTWLEKQAPDDVKFALTETVNPEDYTDTEKKFLNELAARVINAPTEADGSWFHQTIYELKDNLDLEPKEMFRTLYKVLINKDSGPRAGWFLSILPRDWLIKRLRLEI